MCKVTPRARVSVRTFTRSSVEDGQERGQAVSVFDTRWSSPARPNIDLLEVLGAGDDRADGDDEDGLQGVELAPVVFAGLAPAARPCPPPRPENRPGRRCGWRRGLCQCAGAWRPDHKNLEMGIMPFSFQSVGEKTLAIAAAGC
jgi:hypothetical protein